MSKVLLQPRVIGFALGIAFVMACFPTGVEARVVGSLRSVDQPLSPRQAREAQVQRLLAEASVVKALQSAGLNVQEIRARFHRLDDQQLQQLADSLETVKAGKSTIIVLVIVAVLLIGALVYMRIEEA